MSSSSKAVLLCSDSEWFDSGGESLGHHGFKLLVDKKVTSTPTLLIDFRVVQLRPNPMASLMPTEGIKLTLTFFDQNNKMLTKMAAGQIATISCPEMSFRNIEAAHVILIYLDPNYSKNVVAFVPQGQAAMKAIFDGTTISPKLQVDSTSSSTEKLMSILTLVQQIDKAEYDSLFSQTLCEKAEEVTLDSNLMNLSHIKEYLENGLYNDDLQAMADVLRLFNYGSDTRGQEDLSHGLFSHEDICVVGAVFVKIFEDGLREAEMGPLQKRKIRVLISKSKKNLNKQSPTPPAAKKVKLDEEERVTDGLRMDENVFTGERLFRRLQDICPTRESRILKNVATSNGFQKNCDRALNSLLKDLSDGVLNTEDGLKYVLYRILPNRFFSLNDPLQNVYRNAEAVFMRMKAKYHGLSGGFEIQRIDHVVNKELQEKYEKTLDNFQESNVDSKELLLFHGTHVDNFHKIFNDNFQQDAKPVDGGRAKRAAYGRGIYFSEFPDISLHYGSLMLCRVLPGTSEHINMMSADDLENSEIPPGYQSRVMYKKPLQGNVKENHGDIIIVKNTRQILPYCRILFDQGSRAKPQTSTQPQPSQSAKSKPAASSTRPSQSAKSKPAASSTRPSKRCTCSTRPSKSCSCSSCRPLSKFGRYQVNVSFSCVICMCQSTSPSVVLHGCSHTLDVTCALAMLDRQKTKSYLQCPHCQVILGVRTGNQPRGSMHVTYEKDFLPEVDTTGLRGTLVITYTCVSGIQNQFDPNPGTPYDAMGFPRTAYLPFNQDGVKILKLLLVAFHRELIFVVGHSATSNMDNVVVWNGIHHKTSKQKDDAHGYPDDNYTANVMQEMATVGVTVKDLAEANKIIKGKMSSSITVSKSVKRTWLK